MSRIAGMFSSAGGPPRLEWLAAMLSASSADVDWGIRHEVTEGAAIGWCGASTPNIAVRHGVIAVVDGRIYNRASLGAAGTDAELLAFLCQEYGFLEGVRRLNGDFAAVVYDSRIRTLWLARDRFGVKPLYYVAGCECFVFASRPRALLTLPFVTPKVDRGLVGRFAASHYRTFDNDPETSPYTDIAQLPPAHVLRLNGDGGTKTRYWSLEELPDFPEGESGLAERYREVLLDAVALRLRAARRPAFTLSGGMDSSSVLACAVRVTGAKQPAVSSVYEDATYDESNEIRGMLADTVERWHPIHVGTPDILAVVPRMIDLHDEPVATATWLSHYVLCHEARGLGFDGLFGGFGGDELNAGEYEYFPFFFADLRAAGRDADLAREVALWVRHHDHPIFRKSVATMEGNLHRLVDLSRAGRCRPDTQRLHRYAAALDPGYFDLRGFEPVMDHPFSSYLKNRTLQDLERETAPCCLRALDRHGTAFGLDNFLPFLDHRVVEFMFRVPGTLKFRDGVTKHLLREAMREVLPDETRTRIRKTGWNAPAHLWFSGAGRDFLLDMVRSHVFRERGIYNLAEVHRLIDEHDEIVSSGRLQENHMMFLWQLVNLELWLESLDKSPAAPPRVALLPSPR